LQNQFTAKRVIVLTIVFAAMLAWIIWLVNVVGVQGDSGFDDPNAWDPYKGAAIICVIVVIIADILATVAAFRHARNVRVNEERETAERIAKLRAAGFDPSKYANNALERAVAKGAARGGASA
jgi:hypothetical protein